MPANIAFKALIFDVDGTLYSLGGVRRRMYVELGRALCKHPGPMCRAIRVLRAYRRAHEHLRSGVYAYGELAESQIRIAAEWSGVPHDEARAIVQHWTETVALEVLRKHVRQGTAEFLESVRRRGYRLGVFSDYPAAQKLEAMGIGSYFDVVMSAQDGAVQRLKPDPRGLRIATERLGVTSSQALYIGDRPDVDGIAAARAGMKCAIVGSQRRLLDANCFAVADFRALEARLTALRGA